jgi:hypothetical protein
MLHPDFYGTGPNQDFALFKFKGKAGDSTVYWRKSDQAKIVYFIGQEFPSLNWFGGERKRIPAVHKISNPFPFISDLWLENLGTIRSPISTFETPSETSCQIVCFNSINIDGKQCIVSSEDADLSSGLNISPNPAHTFMAIGNANPTQNSAGICRVFNSMGVVVYQSAEKTALDPLVIEVGAWPAGVYTVQVQVKNRVVSGRVVVQ